MAAAALLAAAMPVYAVGVEKTPPLGFAVVHWEFRLLGVETRTRDGAVARAALDGAPLTIGRGTIALLGLCVLAVGLARRPGRSWPRAGAALLAIGGLLVFRRAVLVEGLGGLPVPERGFSHGFTPAARVALALWAGLFFSEFFTLRREAE